MQQMYVMQRYSRGQSKMQFLVDTNKGKPRFTLVQCVKCSCFRYLAMTGLQAQYPSFKCAVSFQTKVISNNPVTIEHQGAEVLTFALYLGTVAFMIE